MKHRCNECGTEWDAPVDHCPQCGLYLPKGEQLSSPTPDGEVLELAKRLLKRSSRPPVFEMHILSREIVRLAASEMGESDDRSLKIIREQSDRIVALQDAYIGLEAHNKELEQKLGTLPSAASERGAFTHFYCADCDEFVRGPCSLKDCTVASAPSAALPNAAPRAGAGSGTPANSVGPDAVAAPSNDKHDESSFEAWWANAGFKQYHAVSGRTVAKAAWQAAQSATREPEGWRLVPTTATADMVQAAEDRHVEGAQYIAENSIQFSLWLEVWRAMLRAAPRYVVESDK